MKQVIRGECDGITSIEVAHQLSTILSYDMAVIMDGGRITEIGSPTDLPKTKSLFKVLWGIQ